MDAVFTAVADPTRRGILERLRHSGALSVRQIADPMAISRQAVTKHLDTLAGAGLIRVKRRGRERLHSLDPQPLRRLGSWLEPYAEFWDERLERLEQHLAAADPVSPDRKDEP